MEGRPSPRPTDNHVLCLDVLIWCPFSIVQVLRPPASRDFTSRALLAAYKLAHPVFEVSCGGKPNSRVMSQDVASRFRRTKQREK